MPSKQMDHLENFYDHLNSSKQMGLMGLGTNDAPPQHQLISTSPEQVMMVDPVSTYLGSESLAASNHQIEISVYQRTHSEQPFLGPHNTFSETGNMSNNFGSQQQSTKGKASAELVRKNSAPHKLEIPNKHIAHLEHRPWLQTVSPPHRRAMQMQLPSSSPNAQYTTTPSKKTVQLESVPRKSAKQNTLKRQAVQMKPSPKPNSESIEAVRSKMRESLAAALALVSQPHTHSPNGAENPHTESGSSPGKAVENSQPGVVPSGSGVDSSATFSSADEFSANKGNSGQVGSVETSVYGEVGGRMQFDAQDAHLNNIFPQDDVSYSENILSSDELLQVNGLSWAMDPEAFMGEKKEYETSATPCKVEKPSKSPELLALEIELELFKLFEGVNKKYKDKGRSLLFNLKDRNNPDLRESVMSGEITPDRLCAMTPEELASKELSQWRQAKEKEMAQMVVLPDTEVDVRRLVKKTHKGEVQIEAEPFHSETMEVSVGSISINRPRSKPKRTVGKKDGANASNENSSIPNDQETSCTITIPAAEGTDQMQDELMVDDELKDADFLAPIVSLDEFMESLDSEPPFENLPAVQEKSLARKDDLEESPEQTTGGSVEPAGNKPENAKPSVSVDVKLSGTDTAAVLKDDHVWEGVLQPTISSVISVIGFFKSGEKTSAKDWPSVLEVKGRVRLEAFEKFLKELPMSRSRAVMVTHFVCKEGSPKSETGSLSEVAHSYITDSRVGYLEPAPGVELYLCPPRSRVIEFLGNVLVKDQLESFNSLDNGLIGVVVWRRPQLTSPNSSSHHHKHSSKNKRRHQDKNSNSNSNSKVKFSSKPTPRPPPEEVDDDDDDDVPPGFGPGVARDEDDLPEFNFSAPNNNGRAPSSNPKRYTPAESQMRELVQKYGQSTKTQRWNKDEDDDIPEWQPQIQTSANDFRAPVVNQLHNSVLVESKNLQQSFVLPPFTVPSPHMQPPQMNLPNQAVWWPQPPPAALNGGQAALNGGQMYYGTPSGAWRNDTSTGGF